MGIPVLLIKLYLIFLTYKMRLVKPSSRIAGGTEIMFIMYEAYISI